MSNIDLHIAALEDMQRERATFYCGAAAALACLLDGACLEGLWEETVPSEENGGNNHRNRH